MSRKSNPVAKLDPDTCVDFGIEGWLVSDAYRKGWDRIFGTKKEKDDDAFRDTADLDPGGPGVISDRLDD